MCLGLASIQPLGQGHLRPYPGKQKTRKKKAAIALARKIAVLAWAMLRDETDWDPKRMLNVFQSFGRTPAPVKEALKTMKPKENSDQRKKRLRREAREAKVNSTVSSTSISNPKAKAKPIVSKSVARKGKLSQYRNLRPIHRNHGEQESLYRLADATTSA